MYTKLKGVGCTNLYLIQTISIEDMSYYPCFTNEETKACEVK